MIIRTLDDVTADSLAAMSSTENPRLREIMTSLVRHLHASSGRSASPSRNSGPRRRSLPKWAA